MNRRARRNVGTGVPVVLPHLVVRPGPDGTVTVSVDGEAWRDGAVRQAELGRVLTRIAEQTGGPVRVEVHDRDGAVYADILNPPAVIEPIDADEPEPGVEVGGGGFVPGEPVHLAVAVSTETAGADGRVTSRFDPTHLDGGGRVVILFGAVSGRTIVRGES